MTTDVWTISRYDLSTGLQVRVAECGADKSEAAFEFIQGDQ